MRAFRLASRRHDPFAGEGAALHGGRWNSRGRPMIYSSAHLSLAVLETLVHVRSLDDLPGDRRYWEFELVDEDVAVLDPGRLNEDWIGDPDHCRAIGDEWLTACRTVALVVPSAVVPPERNVLLNPEHDRMSALRILRQDDFEIDPRLGGA